MAVGAESWRLSILLDNFGNDRYTQSALLKVVFDLGRFLNWKTVSVVGIVGGFMVLPYNHPKWRFLVSKMECFDSWRNKYPNMGSYLGLHGKLRSSNPGRTSSEKTFNWLIVG